MRLEPTQQKTQNILFMQHLFVRQQTLNYTDFNLSEKSNKLFLPVDCQLLLDRKTETRCSLTNLRY